MAAQTTTDYDSDNDGLIAVANLAQLNAIRWDLDGDGAADDASNDTDYAAAFPTPATDMGCPSTGCTGYELTANLNLDTDGDGDVDADDAGGVYWNGGLGWTPIGYYLSLTDSSAISPPRSTATTTPSPTCTSTAPQPREWACSDMSALAPRSAT